MAEFAVPSPPRRRGRPRGGVSDARDRILRAAMAEFEESGYDGATIRAVAARADVDPALVHHYFGTKGDLFAEVIGAPFRPDVDIRHLLSGPRDALGEHIARYVLEAWERPDVRKRGVVLVRAALGNRLATPLIAGFLARELLARVAAELDADDAELRAGLVASQIAGILVARHILKLPAVAAASVDDLVARIGPTIQQYLTG